jgi:hypothetical protein
MEDGRIKWSRFQKRNNLERNLYENRINTTTMQKNHFQRLLIGTWELENGGSIFEIKENNHLSFRKGNGTDTYILEEEEGMLLLTIPSIIEKSEVLSITPTELVVKEFEPGSSDSRVRSFRRLGEYEDD